MPVTKNNRTPKGQNGQGDASRAALFGALPPFIRARLAQIGPLLIALARSDKVKGSRFVQIQLKLLAWSLVTSVYTLAAVQEVLQAALNQLRQIQDEEDAPADHDPGREW
jgi:hypothetical protein